MFPTTMITSQTRALMATIRYPRQCLSYIFISTFVLANLLVTYSYFAATILKLVYLSITPSF
ncbi:hypothetical protein BDN72DRAFT_902049 [Pluteus cervinus]|uniref:Uncharacterized protein n=1 Tax=Pluteus cervinus TaxID=181527 RepID=A0ACD3AEC5_9AGAR|nr:hypothetical protein BDN72DRAFT_902049 [Pluteus cervinus]